MTSPITPSQQQNSIESTPSDPIMLVDNSNPLHQFRSYSYHFFLIACESTEVANHLTKATSTDAFERNKQGLDDSSLRDPITIPTVGKYVIVVDTRHDVDIIIEDVQWGTTFIGDQNSSHSSVALNVVMTDGVINFLEPRGCNFINIIADLTNDLDIDFICMPFLLRTQFYGHTESGQVIPLPAQQGSQPFSFVPTDIAGLVDERGTAYKMEIVGVINGIIHNPNFNALVDGQTFKVYPNKNLQYHLQDIETTLNNLYTDQRNAVIKAFPNLDLSNAANIKYNVTLEPNSIILQNLNDFGTNITDQAKIDSSQHTIKGTKEGGIPEVLNKLMLTSKTWVANAAEGAPPDAASIDNTNKRFTFKVTMEYQNTSASISRGLINVNIYVSEYAYDTVLVTPTINGTTQAKQPKISPNQVIVFDYIYTGQNVDVLKMDINMSLGLSLVQTLSTAKTLSNGGQDTAGGQAAITYPVGSTSFVGPANVNGKVRKGTPIFAPYQWLDTYLKQMEAIQNTATADGVWRSFSNYQSVNTTLTIHGNPLIMGKIMNPDRTIPNYAQINIKMPNVTDDIWEYQLGNNQGPGGYYGPFWYTGYYLMVSAVNKFSGGLFTQDLELVSMPQVSTSQGTTAATETVTDTEPNYRQRFFPNPPNATLNTNTTPTAPVSPNPTPSTSGALGQSTTNPTSSTHQQFVANYWNYALQASQTTGLNPDFALAQAAIETAWGTNRFSRNYSAFFNVRAYGSPNNFWTGAIIPGTNREAGTSVPPFRAYNDPSGSFGDQSNVLSRLYPISASASDINTFADGLTQGKGGRKWAPNDPLYPSNIVSAYNSIQSYKATLGIQNGMMYAGGPTPTNTTPQNNYLSMNTPTSSSTSVTATNNSYATNRTVAQAAIAQKTAIFPS